MNLIKKTMKLVDESNKIGSEIAIQKRYLENIEFKLDNKRNEILLNTDFKNIGLTNDKQREAFVKTKTLEERNKRKIIKKRLLNLEERYEAKNRELNTTRDIITGRGMYLYE